MPKTTTFLKILFLIFLAESAVMLLLRFVRPDMKDFVTVFCDATLLSIISTPFLWWFLMRPLHNTVQREKEHGKEQYRLLFNQSPVGIFYFDTGLHITDCNDRFAQIIRSPRDKIIGLDMNTLRDKTVFSPLADSISGKIGAYEGQYTTTTSSANIWVSLRTAPLIDSAGIITGGVGIVEDITDRKQAEELLFQSEQDWENTFDTITDMITIHDKDYNIIRANKAAEKILGLPILTESKAKCFHHYHGTACPPEGCPSCQSLVTGQASTVEVFEPHLNKFIEIRAIPRLDNGGHLIGLIHIVRDISKRKQIEDSLLEQKLFVENLIHHSAVATFVLDPKHTIQLWNKACEELTGVPASEMIGTGNQWKPFYDHQRATLADIVISKDFDSAAPLYSRVERSSLVANGLHAEGWYKNLNKSDRYIVFDAVPIHNSKGELIVAIETLQDITAMKRMEDGLIQSENRLRAIIEAEPECLKLVAADGTILEMNPAGLAMMEADTPDQVKGKSIYAFVVPEYRPALQAVSERVFEGETGMIEFEIIGLRSTRRWVESRIAPLMDKTGKITSLLAVTRDITEHKKLEGQLRHAQKMEAVGTLTGGIAHDFNNILTAIIGYGNLLKMKMKPDDPLRSHVDQVLSSTERAANLTQSLLAFSRKLVITLKPVNLNDVIIRVEKLLHRLIGEDIVLTTVLTDKDTTSIADSGQIEQVLMNLATNARDAMPNGGSLNITTEQTDLSKDFIKAYGYGKQGTYILITAVDTGTGMDEATRMRIFEPFFTTKEVGKGTGLGLSMVYGIIKQHNGFINCESTPGQGTTFKIYLPLAKSHAPQHIVDSKSGSIPLGGTETVLVAEDDAAVRDLTTSVLKDFGYQVIEAGDGEEAVAKFREHKGKIDLLLLDVIMPRMNGKIACDEIRKMDPGIKSLFTSGYTSNTIHKEGIIEGEVNFILKPISPKDLLNKVREVLDK